VDGFYSKLLKTVASKNDEFSAGNVRTWRKCIERANLHQESTDHKRCFKDVTDRPIIASDALWKSIFLLF